MELSSTEDEYVKSSASLPYGEAMDSTLLELANRLLTSRKQAMQTRDFTSVDALKLALMNAGVSVQMSKDNVVLEPTTRFDKSKLENLL